LQLQWPAKRSLADVDVGEHDGGLARGLQRGQPLGHLAGQGDAAVCAAEEQPLACHGRLHAHAWDRAQLGAGRPGKALLVGAGQDGAGWPARALSGY
jgi:hypothetical protein